MVCGVNVVPCSNPDHVGTPEVAVAPRRRRRVEDADVLGDVGADSEGRVGEPTVSLVHEDDVRAGGVGHAVEGVGLLELVDEDAVEQHPVDQPVRLGLAALPATHRHDVGGGELLHPVVVDVERRLAARRSRLVRDAAAVALDLVEEELVPVLEIEEQARPHHGLLDDPRPEPA